MPSTDPTPSVTADQLTQALGQAVIRIWSNLPQDVQLHLFQEAVTSHGESIRTQLAVFLHDKHPRTSDPLGSQDEADQVLVTVKDCGVGSSAENVDRLFNAFFTTKSSGMGVGLSICRSIIEAHGGRLSASGNVGRDVSVHPTRVQTRCVVIRQPLPG
jgi:signal transduction histidine kinase